MKFFSNDRQSDSSREPSAHGDGRSQRRQWRSSQTGSRARRLNLESLEPRTVLNGGAVVNVFTGGLNPFPASASQKEYFRAADFAVSTVGHEHKIRGFAPVSVNFNVVAPSGWSSVYGSGPFGGQGSVVCVGISCYGNESGMTVVLVMHNSYSPPRVNAPSPLSATRQKAGDARPQNRPPEPPSSSPHVTTPRSGNVSITPGPSWGSEPPISTPLPDPITHLDLLPNIGGAIEQPSLPSTLTRGDQIHTGIVDPDSDRATSDGSRGGFLDIADAPAIDTRPYTDSQWSSENLSGLDAKSAFEPRGASSTIGPHAPANQAPPDNAESAAESPLLKVGPKDVELGSEPRLADNARRVDAAMRDDSFWSSESDQGGMIALFVTPAERSPNPAERGVMLAHASEEPPVPLEPMTGAVPLEPSVGLFQAFEVATGADAVANDNDKAAMVPVPAPLLTPVSTTRAAKSEESGEESSDAKQESKTAEAGVARIDSTQALVTTSILVGMAVWMASDDPRKKKQREKK